MKAEGEATREANRQGGGSLFKEKKANEEDGEATFASRVE